MWLKHKYDLNDTHLDHAYFWYITMHGNECECVVPAYWKDNELIWEGSKYLPKWKLIHEGLTFRIDADFIDDSNCFKMCAHIVFHLEELACEKVITSFKIDQHKWCKFIADIMSKFETNNNEKYCIELEDEGHFLVDWS